MLQDPSSDALPGLLIALLLGLVVGYGLRWSAEPEPSDAPVQVVTETREVVVEDSTKLAAAQDEIRRTRERLLRKDDEIARLMSASPTVPSVDLERARKDMAELRVQLSEQRALRDQRLVEVEGTLATVTEEREAATRELAGLREKNVDLLWVAFVDASRIRICDRGTRKRHAACYEAVASSLEPHQERYARCAASSDRLPTLRSLPLDRPAPSRGRRVKDRKEFTSHGWYVLYCDPSGGDTGAP